jgi:hypothetical protein
LLKLRGFATIFATYFWTIFTANKELEAKTSALKKPGSPRGHFRLFANSLSCQKLWCASRLCLLFQRRHRFHAKQCQPAMPITPRLPDFLWYNIPKLYYGNSPNDVSPNNVSPNDVSPNNVSPNKFSPKSP